MAKKISELTALTSPATDDVLAIVDTSASATKKITTSDLIATLLQTFQLINEIKGWPPVVNTGDLDAMNLWWDKLGTPTTAPTVTDVSGAGLTDTYELCMKVVADAASEGLFQRFTYADEPRVKSGRSFSTLWAIWCVSSVGVTLSIKNSTAEETAATKVTAAAWTIVEVPNHTLAGTYADIILQTDGAGTFYAVPLGANIGAKAFPLPPRPTRFVDSGSSAIVSDVDPAGGGFTDVDLTAYTSNLCCYVTLNVHYNSSVINYVYLRRNGSSVGGDLNNEVVRAASTGIYWHGKTKIPCDDGQIIEYDTSGAAGDTEHLFISLVSFEEWA